MGEGSMIAIGEAQAIINKISTTADGGSNVTISFGADSAKLIQDLLAIKMTTNEMVRVVFIKED